MLLGTHASDIHAHLVIAEGIRIYAARAAAMLRLTDITARVTRVVVGHQAIGRPSICNDIFYRKREEPARVFRVRLPKRF